MMALHQSKASGKVRGSFSHNQSEVIGPLRYQWHGSILFMSKIGTIFS